jgi:serine/threonine protein kinase
MITTTIPIGTVINGCEIVASIGSGGMGAVYKAVDAALQRDVAIKVMHDGGNEGLGKARFLREAAAIAKLDHKGIVKIYSYGEYHGKPFFVMEYVDGWSVKDFVKRYNFIHQGSATVQELRMAGYLREQHPSGQFFLQDKTESIANDPIYPQKVRRLMLSAASALGEAHSMGIIHRDIKSSNILIANDHWLKLIDFGLVKQLGVNELTKNQDFMGTLSYAAPEQLMGDRGQITYRTDIYSFGVVMYELATMVHPIQGNDMAATVGKITMGKIVPPRRLNPKISLEFERIIMKCLEKDPDRRFANGHALAIALRDSQNHSSWFANFTQILKGWFAKEPTVVVPSVAAPSHTSTKTKQKPSASRPLSPAEGFLKSARKKFYRQFSVMEAIDDLRQAYELEPQNTDILFLISFALTTISAHNDVKNYIQYSKEFDQDLTVEQRDKFKLITTIFLERNYQKGLSICKRMKVVYPNDYDLLMAEFMCLEILGNYPGAIKAGRAIEEVGKQNNIVPVALAECYISIMEFENAREVLEERIKQHPNLYNLELKYIQSYLLSGHCKAAKERVERVIEKDPENMFLLITYGRVLTCMGKLSEAFETFRRAVGVPGEEGLRAWGYYSLYLISEILGKNGRRYLLKARELKPTMAYLSNPELRELICSERIHCLDEELGDMPWASVLQTYAQEICYDTMRIESQTLGNYGAVSAFVLDQEGNCQHHRMFCNYNPYDVEENHGQIWLSEPLQSPLIDKNGNILTSAAYEIKCDKCENSISHNGLNVHKTRGHLISIKFDKPWQACSTSYIYCRLTDTKLSDPSLFELPPLPLPARRKQAFLIIVPENKEIKSGSVQPIEEIICGKHKVLCYCASLFAGESFQLKINF